MSSSAPYTAVVIGAGCSFNLGVPTMPAFMDKVFEILSRAGDDGAKDDLEAIRKFLRKVKASGAYVHTQMLNIEELYGLADMAFDLAKGDPSDDLAERSRDALNRAIYRVAKDAGKELLDHDGLSFPSPAELLRVKRESATEELQAWDQGSRYTNLLAYLCLAHHQDRDKSRPLFIQFNWDLALDRALYYLASWRKKSQPISLEGWIRAFPIPPWYEENVDYNRCPRIARPHGGINWIDSEEINCSGKPGHDLQRVRKTIKGKEWNHDVWIDPVPIASNNDRPDGLGDGSFMAIVPPTWRKQASKPAFQDQWSWTLDGLKSVRRIVFIGYSMPKTDLYLRHFLALALAQNDYSPKVYIWNPGILDPENTELRSNYLDFFRPLAQEGRVYGIDGYFGSPALFDLDRAIRSAKPIKC